MIKSTLRWWRRAAAMAAMMLVGAALVGCTQKPQLPKSRWTELPPVELPEYLRGTVMEVAELQATEPAVVSSFGLVVHLRGTGDSRVPTPVREYMIKEMVRRGFGTTSYTPRYRHMQPEDILRDPSVAIVQVEAEIPPGARAGQRIDVIVSALEGNATTSLAHGRLYQCDLRIDGANRMNPGGSVNAYVRVDEGQIFVNPFYSVSGSSEDVRARQSLRQGVVLDAGRVLVDRHLELRLRRPQYSLSRAIEFRLDNLFQKLEGTKVAAAQDEAVIRLLVPRQYNGDWEHFAQVVMHTYVNANVGFLTNRARVLAEEAVKPDAPLLNISYCWEAIGHPALQFIQPLMTHSSPDVAYAAARAAAFIGDTTAHAVLMEMASTPDHPFQLNAVQTLGALPQTPAVSQMLRQLLDGSNALVRIEAYRILAEQKYPTIVSTVVNDKFVLDYVPCAGPPMIYASRTGVPRIAVFGDRAALALPVTFTAMDHAFSISSKADSSVVTIFYRDERLPKPIQQLSRPDLLEIISRLGGEGAKDEARFDFSYSDIVGIVQGLCASRKVYAAHQRQNMVVPFLLQDLPGQEGQAYHAAATVAESDGEGSPPLPELRVTGSDRRPPGTVNPGRSRPQ